MSDGKEYKTSEGFTISGNKNENKLSPDELSALALAFVGDGVFDLFIRTKIVGSGKKVRDLHKEAVDYVKASAQAEILKALEPELTPRESDIVRNARNAKVNTVPKHADIMDYHYSTAFEALLGYLFLSGQMERLHKILNMAFDFKSERIET